MWFEENSLKRRVPDICSIIVNLNHYHTTNRPAARANENGPVTGGCPISNMVTANNYGQHLYRELNSLQLNFPALVNVVLLNNHFAGM